MPQIWTYYASEASKKYNAQAKQAHPPKLSDKSASDLDILRRAHNANYVTEEICSKMRYYCREVAGVAGFEPTITRPKPVALPLGYRRCVKNGYKIRLIVLFCYNFCITYLA